jgi:hypothetical protein
MYLSEAYQRWHSYPPPYNAVSYATPWMWYDGNPHGSYTHSTWQTKILQRMNEDAPVVITMWGNYNPTTRAGTINARYWNETPFPLTGFRIFVVTEDSIQRSTPNGDQWHNHVARDYIPDYTGSLVDIPAGEEVTYSQPFSISSSWNVNQCEIVTFFQNNHLTPDSIKEIYQGAMIKVRDLPMSAIEQGQSDLPVNTPSVTVSPNPCVNKTRFAFSLLGGQEYKINIFDVSGRSIKTLNSIASGEKQLINCEFVKAGVYFYRFSSDLVNTTGKIIVK